EEVFSIIGVGAPQRPFRGQQPIVGRVRIVLIVHLSVKFWSPGRAGTQGAWSVFRLAVGVIQIPSANALTVFVLVIGPAVNGRDRGVGAERITEAFLLAGARLGCDNNGPVRPARTVKSGCSRTLQYRYAFNIVRIDVGNTAAKVDRRICADI